LFSHKLLLDRLHRGSFRFLIGDVLLLDAFTFALGFTFLFAISYHYLTEEGHVNCKIEYQNTHGHPAEQLLGARLDEQFVSYYLVFIGDHSHSFFSEVFGMFLTKNLDHDQEDVGHESVENLQLHVVEVLERKLGNDTC